MGFECDGFEFIVEEFINHSCVSVIVSCCFFVLLQAIFKLIPKDEVANLPADENTAEKRAEKLWKYFDKGDDGETNTPQIEFNINKTLKLTRENP